MTGSTKTTADNRETAKWDPAFTEQIAKTVGPVIKRWYRAEVRNLDNVPSAGGALVVSDHSGGMLTPDVLIFSPAFYDAFGYDRTQEEPIARIRFRRGFVSFWIESRPGSARSRWLDEYYQRIHNQRCGRFNCWNQRFFYKASNNKRWRRY